jgi:WD40 repeat protein/tetratricopeptide (TPR) repeat protein
VVNTPPPEVTDDGLVGRRLGPYRIERRVGHGGMGSVYQAQREGDYRQQVAVKVIRPGLAGDEVLSRFRTERQVLAELNHPHIARLLDGGATEDGRPYFVMEFIDGQPLDTYCERQRLGTRERLGLLLAVCGAVQHAHERQVLHRDLKPDNVLVTADGTPKVTDFGLAKRLDGLPRWLAQTQTGAVMGTPGYMAPEQAAGRPADVGPATDVYALGAILYELLTGRPPFRGATPMDTLRLVLSEEPVSPGRLHPNLPRDLETICLKCLQKEPHKRYAGVAALADDLRRFLDGRPILARPTPAWEKAWKWAKRRPVVAALGATVGLAAGVLLVVILVYTALLKEKRDIADAKAREAQEAAGREREAAGRERDARLQAQDKAVRLAVGNGSRRLLDGDLTGALPWYVDALREDRRDPPDDADAAREQTHRVRLAAVLRQCPRLAHVWFHGRRVTSVGFSPAGDRLLVATRRAVHVYDAATGEPAYPPLEAGHSFEHAAFSPTGKFIVTTTDVAGEVCLWDAATGRPGRTLRPAGAPARRAVLSPDEARLLIVSGLGVGPEEARVYDVASGEPWSPPVKHDDAVVAAEFSADGSRVLTAAASEVRVWYATSGALVFPPLDYGGRLTHAALSPDGRRVAATGFGRPVRLWDAATGRPTFTPPAATALMGRAAFGPDSYALVAVGKGEGAGGEARAWEAAAGRPRTSWHLAAEGVDVAFSPDGARVLVVEEGGAVRVWMALSGAALTPPLRTGGSAQAAFSPDGRFLLTAGADGVARLWDLALGGPRTVALGDGPDARPFEWLQTWSGDGGRSLVSASGPANGPIEVRVWDTADAKPLSPALKHPTRVTAAALGPGGRLATSDVEGRVRLWDRADGRLVSLLNEPRPAKVVGFATGGRLLTLGDDGSGAAWGAENGEALPDHFDCGPLLWDAAFSGDGRRLATVHGRRGQGEWEVRLWDTATGAAAAPPVSLREEPVGAALSADGSRLLTATTGAKEGEARVWDGATGRAVSPPLRVAGISIRAALSPDGRLVAAGGLETGARVWDAATGEPITPALPGTVAARQLLFVAGGLVTLSERRQGFFELSHWDLAPGDLPPDDLRRLADVLSGERIGGGGPATLSPAELRASWEELAARQPGLRTAPPEDVLAWHRRAAEWCQRADRWALSLHHLDALLAADPQDAAALRQRARAHEELGRWAEALADAGRAVELRPRDAAARNDRGRIRARAGRYKEAAADFRAAAEIDPTDPFPRAQRALMHLADGDAAGYRAACMELFDRFAGSQRTADRVAVVWTCCLGPGALADAEGPVRLAERLGPAGRHFPLLLRGAAECRAGRPGATTRLKEAIQAHGGDGTAHDWLFLALAHQRQDQAAEARRCLDRAARVADQPALPLMPQWEVALTTRLLRQEVEAALSGGKP